MAGELKPKSFRIDDETAEKFKEISSKIGGSQQETLSKLIEAFEFQSGKAVLTDKKDDIERFEKYVTAITRMFMGSLEDNQNLTETIRTEFDALLKSKEATIQDLQEKLVAAKQLKEENSQLHATVDRLNTQIVDMQSRLDDKDHINQALTDSCNDLKARVESMSKAAKMASELQSQLDQLRRDYAASENTVAQLRQHEADALARQKEQMQLANERSILQAQGECNAQLQKLIAENRTEIDSYQKKYFSLLEQIQARTRSRKRSADTAEVEPD